jgi:hypothetical protein
MERGLAFMLPPFTGLYTVSSNESLKTDLRNKEKRIKQQDNKAS